MATGPATRGRGRKAPAKAPRPPRKPASRANANRGEHSLTLADTTYVLRPSYAAIVAIEDALERSAIEILRAANTCSLGYEELGTIAGALIRAGAAEGDAFTANVADERIAELIFEEGCAEAMVALTVVLASAVSGGRSTSGEARPVATKG